MLRKKLQMGFTLLELMFVVAIIAILASVSLPLYQDSISKAQIHAAYHTLSTLKLPTNLKVTQGEEIQDISDLGWLTDSTDIFATDPNFSINSIGIVTIVATLDGKVNPLARGVIITLSRDVFGSWSCNVVKSPISSWKDSFAPDACTIT